MQKQKFDLITVSREFGEGGSDFAAGLGKRLGWQVLDQDLIRCIAIRVERLIARYGWDQRTAIERAHHIDADRNAYAQRYYHREWRDPLLYDLTINTGRITIDEATTLVEAMLR